MNILLPNIVYAKIFAKIFPQKYHANINFKQASLLSRELANENYDIALIPSFDLLTHPNFIISERFGISYDGLLSSANIFYQASKKSIEKIQIAFLSICP